MTKTGFKFSYSLLIAEMAKPPLAIAIKDFIVFMSSSYPAICNTPQLIEQKDRLNVR